MRICEGQYLVASLREGSEDFSLMMEIAGTNSTGPERALVVEARAGADGKQWGKPIVEEMDNLQMKGSQNMTASP